MKKFSPFYIIILIICFSFSLFSNESVVLTKRQLCDLEMLMVGAFDPLDGYLGKDDYDSVVQNTRLSDGQVWPMPIMLDIDENLAKKIHSGDVLELRDEDKTLLAYLHVSDIWSPNKDIEAEKVYGTLDTAHPGVFYLFEETKNYYVGGKIEKIRLPFHADFSDLRKTPEEMKAYFKEQGIEKIVAFQTRNPMHRAHMEITKRASLQENAHLLIQPIVGETKPGDIDPYVRVRCYRKILSQYPEGSVTMSVLPLAMRMAGPKEALWHALIRKNFGCTHFIVGRDHAGPGNDSEGNPFYGAYEAQDLVSMYAHEIGIKMVPFQAMGYIKDENTYIPLNELKPNQKIEQVSGTELRRLLDVGEEIPSWFSFPEVIEELQKAHPPLNKRGITLFFTGFSGAGKSTIGNAVADILREIQDRQITILDGDLIRQHLSKGLGFSKEDRSSNVRRVGFVASEITKNSGIAICCLIAPYEDDRAFNKDLINHVGEYVEIHIATPLEECESRDVKGLYAKARQGIIKDFTGIDDPYETPKNPALYIDTTDIDINEAANIVIEYLKERGLLTNI